MIFLQLISSACFLLCAYVLQSMTTEAHFSPCFCFKCNCGTSRNTVVVHESLKIMQNSLFLHQCDLKRHQNSGLTEPKSLSFPIYRKSHTHTHKLLDVSLCAKGFFVCMTMTNTPVCPVLFLPSQSFNDKRKKNFTFTRKFPFYKNKEGEQDGSDSERK